jgi:hypothetical protein
MKQIAWLLQQHIQAHQAGGDEYPLEIVTNDSLELKRSLPYWSFTELLLFFYGFFLS